jgi:hypothetical protein
MSELVSESFNCTVVLPGLAVYHVSDCVYAFTGHRVYYEYMYTHEVEQ